jgi:transcriptional regulator with XRE-family HTH domain
MVHSLNENIKRLRIARGMNQVDFARLLGVTKQCVSNWENDNVLPGVEMLIKIADIFKVRTDYLLGREEGAYIDLSLLTEEQRGHIALIIRDFEKLNK